MRLASAIIWLEARLRSATGNRVSLVGIAGLPSVQITVPGRRTGISRTTSLLAVPLGDALIVTGSNWGRAKTPAWSWNLGEVDVADVHVGARSRPMSVHRVTAGERDAYWRDIVYYWPGYEMEQRLARHREFPMFLLEPVAAGDSAARDNAAPGSDPTSSDPASGDPTSGDPGSGGGGQSRPA